MLIRENLKLKSDFSANESCVAEYLLNHEQILKDLSARFIASETYTSPSTVVRLCKKLGYDGFNDFKEDYLKELKYSESNFKNIDANYPFTYQDKNIVIANKIGILYKETIDDTLSLIDNDVLLRATNILKKSKIIYVCSSGVQSELASVFRDKMAKIGKIVVIDNKLDDMFYAACYAGENCCFLMISYSGETEMLLRVAKKVNEKNIPSIAITSFGKNTLSSLIDCCINLSTREKLITNLGSFGINISTMFLLDILYANCFNLNYEGNIENKLKYSFEFEKYRHSENPILHEEKEE